MNLLFINRMMDTAWGGGENYDYNLAESMRLLGHQVLFLTAHPPGVTPKDHIGNLEMISLETPYIRRFMYQLAGKVKYIPGLFAELDRHLFQRKALTVIKSLLKSRSIDLIQVLSIPVMAEHLAAQRLPVVMRFPGPPAWFLSRCLQRFSRRKNTAMFSHGDTVKVFRDRLGIGIYEVPPGIRKDLYLPSAGAAEQTERRADWGLSPSDFVLVTVGRLIAGKGHDFLIETMRRLVAKFPNAKLLVVGDGPLRGKFESKARRLGVGKAVVFAGQQPKEGVARCLSCADVFCLLSEYENFSNATLEAMSCGLPVVASRVGGFPLQVFDEQNGFLVDYGDHAELAAKLVRLAPDAVLRRRLAQGAREYAGGFSWLTSANRVSEIYAKVLSA
jgi:glycosyltransferase involved in cell wall biosynthesis